MHLFCSFWLIFYPLDPDPGSQNLADPTDPDPKHWQKYTESYYPPPLQIRVGEIHLRFDYSVVSNLIVEIISSCDISSWSALGRYFSTQGRFTWSFSCILVLKLYLQVLFLNLHHSYDKFGYIKNLKRKIMFGWGKTTNLDFK